MVIGCGNLGAPPKPPQRASKRVARWCAGPVQHRPAERARRSLWHRVLQRLADLGGAAVHLAAPRAPRIGQRGQHLGERGHPVARLGRVVGAAVERAPVGREEHRHRPPAVPRHPLHRRHVDAVDVRPLLAVHLDVDEVLVHQGGRLGILERLVLHHVAPVARRVAHREQDRPVLRPRALQRLGSPGVPVHRVVPVLQQVRAGLVSEAVGHGPERFRGIGWSREHAAKRGPGMAHRFRWTGLPACTIMNRLRISCLMERHHDRLERHLFSQ
jgi:hypothetical protein